MILQTTIIQFVNKYSSPTFRLYIPGFHLPGDNLPKENNHGSQRQHLLYQEHPGPEYLPGNQRGQGSDNRHAQKVLFRARDQGNPGWTGAQHCLMCFLALKLANRRRYSSGDTWCMDQRKRTNSGISFFDSKFTNYDNRQPALTGMEKCQGRVCRK